VLTIAVQTPRGTYEGNYLVERAAPTSQSLGFVALLKKVGIVRLDGRYTPLPVATELRGRWQGRTEREAVEDLTQQFESWARAQP
jgi:hypothetical protein